MSYSVFLCLSHKKFLWKQVKTRNLLRYHLLTGAGAAYVFTKDGTTWTQEQKLVGTGTNARIASDSFGSAVAVSENGASDGYTFGIGATGQDYTSTGTSPVSSGAGAVFIFY
jgi:hypothetical protein